MELTRNVFDKKDYLYDYLNETTTMKRIAFPLFLIASILVNMTFAQEEAFPCEADQVNSNVFQSRPELQSHINSMRNELEAFTYNYVNNTIHEKSEDVYIIPIVFHIIHDNGAANISEAQIQDGIRLINEQFRKLNADTVNIVEEFKHLAADVKVEFRLAKLDPDGNCTNGINRIFSPLTNMGGHVVKDLIQWPPNKYLNIWTSNVAGTSLAGHCLMPPVADTIPEWDGIVIQHSYVGEMGTSNHTKRTVLTHEIGHYLNLYHIWGGNNVPDFYYLPVASPENCEHDDMVEDTPNTIGWQSCNTSANTCESLDMVQNYMDYSYCSLLFTEGQKQRMRATLNSPVANRNNLWTEENLIATGVIDGFNPLCKADIIVSKKLVCLGEEVTFSDNSFFDVTSRNWTFEGANISSSTDSTVTVQFQTLGKHNVKLSVARGTETIDSTFVDFIEVIENIADKNYVIEDFENETGFNNKWRYEAGNPLRFERTNYGKNSEYSMYIDNFNGADKADYHIQTLGIDATEMTKLAIAFDYAYAKSTTSNSERVYFYLSKDCGTTWQNKGQFSLFNNATIETDVEFFPTEENWSYKEVEINLNNYKVENLMIRIVFSANRGNNLFLDNINICDINSLAITSELLDAQLKVFPNPAKEILNLRIDDKFLNGEVSLYDVLGNVVIREKVVNQNEMAIDIQRLRAGTYFLKYSEQNGTEIYSVRKIVVE